ncbi:TlpA disulfide reductase family protein [Pedobacter sp. KR3-3]|uniref:TlpA disulfide reductase family protein n=1 Tax=Pedobacter albus TaxID=3113905 RepID=A0ABU7I6D4_9SPHI|nr:TlpA disulfide reductase family protein [Pedobacter sp. KR3-3]MEE1944861.1 TlpA disulfide reductase family protein [Pedobacter sp. KR3-3]
MKYLTLIVAVAFISIESRAQIVPLIGKEAPRVIFQSTTTKPVNPDFYKGKILVLDFWATWCAPCIANFPHFNQLAEKYSSKNVLFAVISDEQPSTIKKFFERSKKEIKGLSITDTSKVTKKAFGVLLIPFCVVIDQNNVVRWTGPGQSLTPSILEKIIKGEPLNIVEKIPKQAEATSVQMQKPLFTFSVGLGSNAQKTRQSRTNREGDLGELLQRNYQLGDVMEYISGYGRTTQIITNDTAKLSQLVELNFESKLDTTLFRKYRNQIIPGNPRRNMIMEMLGDALRFDVKSVNEQKEYYDLVVSDPNKLKPFQSLQDKHSSISPDKLENYEIVGYSLKDIAQEVQKASGIIIRTDISGDATYDLSLNLTDIASLQKTLGFHGLQLKRKTGEISFIKMTFY